MSAAGERFAAAIRRFADAVLNGRGDLPPAVRHAIAGRAAGRSGVGEVPAALLAYVDTVARHAYRVTPDDVAALRAAGLSEDAVFEATVAAALGAGLHRLERGLAALRAGT